MFVFFLFYIKILCMCEYLVIFLFYNFHYILIYVQCKINEIGLNFTISTVV